MPKIEIICRRHSNVLGKLKFVREQVRKKCNTAFSMILTMNGDHHCSCISNVKAIFQALQDKIFVKIILQLGHQ